MLTNKQTNTKSLKKHSILRGCNLNDSYNNQRAAHEKTRAKEDIYVDLEEFLEGPYDISN